MEPTIQNLEAEFGSFMAGMGKTLSRINLYPMSHPLVKESIQNSYNHLSNSLSQEAEITVAWIDDKLLLNGKPLPGLGTLQNILGGLFERYQLHSLTFKSGITIQEITSFYVLLSLKGDFSKDAEGIKNYLERENIQHITPDVSFFAKVTGKDQPHVGIASAPPIIEEAQGGERPVARMIENLEQMSLESMLWEVIQKAVPGSDDQKKIYQIIFKQLQNDIQIHIKSATQKIEQAKEIAENEQERTKSVINHIADGIIVVNELGQIVMMNPTAEKIYGATFSEMKGKQVGDNAKEELSVAMAKELTEAKDKELSKEVTVQSSGETHSSIRNSTTVIQNPEGKIVGMMSMLNDIAKQKELQRMQNDFIAHVTHELRSPLTAIKASISTIYEDTGLDSQEKHVLLIANRNIDRLARLINDLLDCTKIESGKMTVNPKPADLSLLLQETASSLSSWAQNRQLTLQLHIPPTLPKVFADYDRIIQVVVNLMSNSIKFTPPNGTITIQAKQANPLFVKISISDTGTGIPKEKLNRLFQRFFQLQQKEKLDTPGTGLGLYISKTIVELHKGEIGVSSVEGKGTTFSFTLPIVQEAKPATPVAQEAAPKKKGWFARLFGGS